MGWKDELCKCKQNGILHMEISDTDYNNLSEDQQNNGTVYFIYATDSEGEKTGKGVIYRYGINFVSSLVEEVYNAGMQDYDGGQGEIFNTYEGEDMNAAVGSASHAEGGATSAYGDYSHTEGYMTQAENYAHAEGNDTQALGDCSHAEGTKTVAHELASHAEGDNTEAQGVTSHAEGKRTQASGNYSHAEGTDTVARGLVSHSEGCQAVANGAYSHAEGYNTTTQSDYSHVEGRESRANGEASHAEGFNTFTSGQYSHTEGEYTNAEGIASHASGKYNQATYQDSSDQTQPYLFTVGNGTADNDRSNAIAIDYSGNTKISGQYKDQTGLNLVPIVPIDISDADFISEYTDIAGFLASADARSDVFYAFYDGSQNS